MDSDMLREMTDEQKKILITFKKDVRNFKPPEHSDTFLLKCLKSKNFNLKETERVYLENVKFHEIIKHDFTKDWSKNKIIGKYEFDSDIGTAKDGTPLRYLHIGNADLRGFVWGLDTFDIVKFCVTQMMKDGERCMEQSNKLGREIHSRTYVVDMDGFSLRQIFYPAVIELAFDLFRAFQEYYPEIWNIILIINAPAYFHIAFNIFKPIFGRSLLSKIVIASKERSAELLLKYIDQEVLPVSLGGYLIDSNGDPTCSEFINYGGPIPEQYYLRNLQVMKLVEEGVTKISIGPRCSHTVAIPIEKINSMIRMEFRTEGGSVMMLIFHRNFGTDTEDPDLSPKNEYFDEHNLECNIELISPTIHYQSHLAPVDNTVCAVYPGIYIFKFMNSNSWFASKPLIYRFTVLTEDD